MAPWSTPCHRPDARCAAHDVRYNDRFESTTSSEDLGKKVEKAQRKTGTRFYDNQVSRIATTLSDGTSMTTEQINYLTLNNTAIANTISSASATFNNKTIATAPDNFTLGQEAFAVYVNNTYIPNDQRTVAQDSSNIVVTFVTNDIGYLLESTDEVVIVGKFS